MESPSLFAEGRVSDEPIIGTDQLSSISFVASDQQWMRPNKARPRAAVEAASHLEAARADVCITRGAAPVLRAAGVATHLGFQIEAKTGFRVAQGWLPVWPRSLGCRTLPSLTP